MKQPPSEVQHKETHNQQLSLLNPVNGFMTAGPFTETVSRENKTTQANGLNLNGREPTQHNGQSVILKEPRRTTRLWVA